MKQEIIEKTNGACLIINDQDKMLLIRRDVDEDSMPGLWELPSGTIEKGEKIVNGLIREVEEETGIMLKIDDLRHADIEHYEFENKKGVLKKVIEHTYCAKLDYSPSISVSGEHDRFAWVPFEELDDYYEDKNDRIYKRIKKILES